MIENRGSFRRQYNSYPPLTLSDEIIEKLVETTKKIAINMKIKA